MKHRLPHLSIAWHACADRPVVLRATDYHTVWCNTAALESAETALGHAIGGAHLAPESRKGKADPILDTLRKLVSSLNSAADDKKTAVLADLYFAADTWLKIAGEGSAKRKRSEEVDLATVCACAQEPLLLVGPPGAGKSMLASRIYDLRKQRAGLGGRFVEVNCAAIPSELIESELFGHMKGSFTGAIADRAGKFEQADGGTLFLDEIGDMSLSAQAKVLRVLQDGFVTRIGGSKPIQVDVRVLAATNKNLEEEIANGRFREDLFYRLNVIRIAVPPLRERVADVPAICAAVIERIARDADVDVVVEAAVNETTVGALPLLVQVVSGSPGR